MLRKSVVVLFTGLLLITAGVARAQTNYPVESRVEVRDANGNLVSGEVGLFPGDPMNILAEGWQPGATITFTFFSDPIHLGTRVADSQGVVRATFPVPNVPPGMHTLRMTGTGRNGQPRTVDWPVRVLARSQVAGVSQDRPAAPGSSSSGSSAFGRTGIDNAREIGAVGFALLAVGAAIVVAVRRSRRGALA